MTNLKIFSLNGNRYRVNNRITIYNLIEYMGYKQNLIVIEYNHKIILKTTWKETQICHNDTIEIITIVGGG